MSFRLEDLMENYWAVLDKAKYIFFKYYVISENCIQYGH